MEARIANVQPSNAIKWEWYKFKDLTNINCYKLLQLRAKIFIEEQGYAFNDLDNLDYNALHLIGFFKSKTKKHKDELIAYARLFFPKPNTVEVGRVTVHEDYRKLGIGSTLMNEIINTIDKQYPHYQATLKIGVDQYSQHLPKFYRKFGFELNEDQQACTHANYDYKNFDFPTLEMTRAPQPKAKQINNSKIANRFLSFFKQDRLKEKNNKSPPSLQPRI